MNFSAHSIAQRGIYQLMLLQHRFSHKVWADNQRLKMRTVIAQHFNVITWQMVGNVRL